MNKYTKPVHTGISTALDRRYVKPMKKRRKYLREPVQKIALSWMDIDISSLSFVWHSPIHSPILLNKSTEVQNPFKST